MEMIGQNIEHRKLISNKVVKRRNYNHFYENFGHISPDQLKLMTRQLCYKLMSEVKACNVYSIIKTKAKADPRLSSIRKNFNWQNDKAGYL